MNALKAVFDMSRITFDSEKMKLISLFQTMTSASVKDCFENDELVFIVGEGEIGKALGKKGMNARRISQSLKRKIKIVEFSRNLSQFIKNLVHPLKIADVEEEDGVITLTAPDTTTRGYLIGRGGSALRKLEERVKRHFPIKEIKVAQK